MCMVIPVVVVGRCDEYNEAGRVVDTHTNKHTLITLNNDDGNMMAIIIAVAVNFADKSERTAAAYSVYMRIFVYALVCVIT